MNDVFICGAGLQSCQGSGLAASIQALSKGAVDPCKVSLPGGQIWPYYLMPGGAEIALAGVDPSTWRARITNSVQRVMDECLGPRTADAAMPAVYIASSSIDLGGAPPGSDYATPLCDFAHQLALAENWARSPVVVNTACTSAFTALHMAWSQLASGQEDGALILGIETFNQFALSGFEAMQLLAPERAEPLGEARQGLVLGEAVAALKLTNKPPAEADAGSLGVWRILAYANVVEGASSTGASESAMVEACCSALRAGNLRGEDIDLIKLQAAGSPSNDAVEMAALRSVFEVLPPCVSFKAALGHTLGASCAAETALMLACLESDVWPQLDYVLDPEVEGVVVSAHHPLDAASVQTILLIGLGFGGGHSVLILKRHLA